MTDTWFAEADITAPIEHDGLVPIRQGRIQPCRRGVAGGTLMQPRY